MKTKAQKIKEARLRAQERSTRTPKQQIKLLESRPGEHKRELTRLHNALNQPPPLPPTGVQPYSSSNCPKSVHAGRRGPIVEAK